MRKDLDKVVTERPRRGSSSENLSTRWHINRYDGETDEGLVSLPKIGKMKMHNRELGPWNEDKDFSDNLGPLERWAKAQVGRPWNKVFSEIRKTFPHNKLNDHLVYTHLLGYFNIGERLDNEVEAKTFTKSNKRTYRKIYRKPRYGGKAREIWFGDIYVDPDTGIICRYNKGDRRLRSHHDASKTTTTGWALDPDGKILVSYEDKVKTTIEAVDGVWFRFVYAEIESEMVRYPNGDSYHPAPYFGIKSKKQLNKKELKFYGVTNQSEKI